PSPPADRSSPERESGPEGETPWGDPVGTARGGSPPEGGNGERQPAPPAGVGGRGGSDDPRGSAGLRPGRGVSRGRGSDGWRAAGAEEGRRPGASSGCGVSRGRAPSRRRGRRKGRGAAAGRARRPTGLRFKQAATAGAGSGRQFAAPPCASGGREQSQEKGPSRPRRQEGGVSYMSGHRWGSSGAARPACLLGDPDDVYPRVVTPEGHPAPWLITQSDEVGPSGEGEWGISPSRRPFPVFGASFFAFRAARMSCRRPHRGRQSPERPGSARDACLDVAGATS